MEAYEYLEKEWAEFCDVPYTVACASGTAALHLAIEALELPPESKIIVPEFTMVACARAVQMAGLKNWFVDCENNGLMAAIRRFGDSETEAAMPVHVYGRQCQIDYYGRYVIEDLSEAHGVNPHPKTDAACWSFYRNKIIHGEEGGMIAFKDQGAAERARELRSLGFTKEHNFLHRPRGHNYRMSNLHAQAIRKCLSWYPEIAEDRRQIEGWYNEFIPPEWHMPARDAVWVYDLRIPGLTEPQQDSIIKELNSKGIAARHAFKPMSRQPEFAGPYEHLNAHRLSREVLYLPVSPGMTQADVRHAADVLEAAVQAVRRPLAGMGRSSR